MSEKELVSCDHKTVESSGTRKLVVNCKRCEKEHSLSDCLPSLILSLEDEYNIDSIIVSDFLEEQYIGSGVKILSQIRDIAGEMETFSSRGEDEKKCMECELKPSILYPRLKRKFIQDPGIIYEMIGNISVKVERKENCHRCRRSLGEELEILGNRAISLRSEVLKEGFDIIG